MKKQIKRWISAMLCLVMALQMLPLPVAAQEAVLSAVDLEPQVQIMPEKLTAYCVDTSTGEEIFGFGKGPFDLAQQKDWGTFEVIPAVWDENWEQRLDLTSGTTEFFWCYAFDKSGFCPIGMMPGKWGELVQQHQEKHPEDYENLLLIAAMDGWTTDPTVPAPCTVGELLGTDAPYYLPNYILVMYMRYTAENGEVVLLPWAALQGEVMVINSESEDGWRIPTEFPYAVSAKPLDWGYGNRGMAVSQLPEKPPAGGSKYLTVCSNIHEQETPVVYLPHAASMADGMVAPGAYCSNGLDNGTCGCYNYLWVVPAKGDAFPDSEFITPRDFVPVGMDVMQWQDLCSVYEKEDPKAWASGDYTGLYSRDELNWSWSNRLPMYSEGNISGVDWDHSDRLEDYQTRTYACVVRWEYCTYTVDEEDNWIENRVTRFGFSEPVTIVPMDPSGSGDPADPDEPEDPGYPSGPDDPRYTPATPLPGGYTRGLEWFGGVELACDAAYEGADLSYQWFRSLTPEDDSDDIPFDDDYYHGTGNLCWAEFPEVDELDQTYYYYCEYSFTDRGGVVQTYRTTACALRRAPCSVLEVKVSPGAFYLEKDPDNTDYYSPAYMRAGNETLPLSDPDDYTLTYAYQAYGGESVLSAWIETESLYSSYGFLSSDYITWQWYKSSTEDWTQGEKIGDEGRVEGLTEISLSKPMVSGTQSLISYGAFNKHANIHVDCPTDTLEPFYMTVVITNHYTNAQGEEVTSESIARCKVFTFEENEELYSVDENGMLDGYNGHESVWNIPVSVDGRAVTSIGVMAQTVRPPAGSDVRHHAGPTKIVIPEGVTEIGNNAFYRLYSLEEVVLPDTLRRIGSYAFGDTGTMERIDLPSSVEELASCAFAGARIQEFAFHPDVWPAIGGSAFSGSSIKQVIFPANATGTLNGHTFHNCTRLASVQNWTNIQDLDRYADFRYTPAYEYMVEGSSGDSDGSFIYQPDNAGTGWAVIQCVLEDTETVTIPASFKGKPVTTVGRGPAQNGTATGAAEQLVEDVLSIRHLVLPDTVHTIRQRAFDGCENLETVNFHSNISLVEREAFRNCYRLTSTVTLAEGAHIQTEAFIHCRSITRLDAPGARIAHYAFAYCFSLEQITDYVPWLPELNNETSYAYFEGYVYWPFAYTKTYTDARESVRYYHSPDGAPDVQMAKRNPGRRYGNTYYNIWENDPTKGTIELYMGTEETHVSIPGVAPAVDGNYEVALVCVGRRVFEFMNTECYDVVFGEGISIFENALSTAWKTTRMRHVTLPQSATDLGTFFQSEYGNVGLLESINIPSGIIQLEPEAFQGNKKLHTVTFEENSGLVTIGKLAFSGCAALQEIDFSNLKSLTTIEEGAFRGCDLRTVDLRACTSLTELQRYAFSGMYNIRSICLPDGLEEIGASAFEDEACNFTRTPQFLEVIGTLNPLQELVLPVNLKKIGKRAFRGQFMDNTANAPFVLELPDRLEEIGNEAFGGYETNVRADMELLSNVVLKDGRLPESLKAFGSYSTKSDDENGTGTYSPFALSVMDTLTFPAGLEILGLNACMKMPKLTTVIFEAKEQQVPGSGETVYTGSLRELHPGSLDSGYAPDGWAYITDIQGFENLRLLEYAEDVFGVTAQYWKFTGESYTVPGTVKRLGQFALTDYGFSSLNHIIIEAGVEQIDNYAISKRADQVGDYITALEKSPTGVKLADAWLDSQDFNTEAIAILRCYTGSAYHLWAEAHDYPYELLDDDARVVSLDLILDGEPVSNPGEWLDSCRWTDSQGNVVSNDCSFRDAREGETYTVTATLAQEKLRAYALPQTDAAVKLEAGQRAANVRLPLSPRGSVTIRGVLPQHREVGFRASIVQTHFPYATIAEVHPDANTGAFTVEIPFVDCKLVLRASGETPYVETVYENFAMMGVYNGQTVDAGALTMDFGPMTIVPIDRSVSLQACGALKVTDEEGNEYSAQLCAREVNGVSMDCLSIKSAIWAGVTVGDELTLSSRASMYAEETMIPYTFTVPRYDADFTIKPTVLASSKLLYMSTGYCYVYDQNGNYVESCNGRNSRITLSPGSYTAIQIGTDMFRRMTLAGFQDLDESLYRRTDFTITEESGETFLLDKPCPDFDFSNAFGIQLRADSAMMDADGRVPVYLQLNLSEQVPEGAIHFELSADTDVLPFVELDGAFAVADQPGILTDVRAQAGGGHQRAALSFTTTARTGVITFYAKPDGASLTLKMDYYGRPLNVAFLKLPEKGFTLNEPPSMTQAEQGVLTLFAGGDVDGHEAAVLVNGKEQNRYSLRATGSGANTLSYTLKTYPDGSSLQTLQVLVFDGEDTLEWASQVYTLTHTHLAVPQPQNLNIRITNMNATYDDGSEGRIDGVNTVEQASLNFITGEYRPMKFVVPYWYYNEDGTMAKEITFDYALSITNPELIEDGEITLKVFCREIDPYVREVKLHYNQMTDTFDGTLFIPGGTITVNDLPYGFTLAYGTENVVAEPMSRQFLIDQANEQMEERQELLAIEAEELDPVNLDHLYHWLEEEGISGDEREQFLQIAVLNNEISDIQSRLRESMQTLADSVYDMESGKSWIMQMQQYLEQAGASVTVAPLEKPMTPEQLLGMGFEVYRFDLGEVYIKTDSNFSKMVWLDPENPENSLQLDCGTVQLFGSSDESGGVDLSFVLRQTLGLISTLCGTLEVSVGETITLLEELNQKLNQLKPVREYAESDTWKKYEEVRSKKGVLTLEDMAAMTDEARGMEKPIAELKTLQKDVQIVQQAANAGDFQTLRVKLPGMKGVTAIVTKTLGGAARFIPIAGTLIGTAMVLWDAISLGITVYDREKELKGYWEDYDEWDKLVNDLPEGICHNEERMEDCSKSMGKYKESIETMDTFAAMYYWEKFSLLSLDAAAIAGSIVVGIGNVAAGVLGLGSAGLGLGADWVFNSKWNELRVKMLEAGINLQCSGIYEICEEGSEEPDNKPPKGSPPSGEDPDYETPPKPVIDPSGYVYEAVASNRIRGAAAQVFYRDAGGNEVLWDEAPLYDEINPQTTDSFGTYGWMTPPGKWRVKITKDGYLPADSKQDPAAEDGWLPVPPPQLNVNIGLTSTAAPKIESAAVAADQVRVVFSQYMDIAAFEAEKLVVVKQDGTEIPVSFEFVDAEESPTQPGVFYGRILKLVKADGTAFSGSGFTVTVDADAKNYTAKALGETYTSPSMTAKQILGVLEHTYPNRYVTEISETQQIVVVAKGTDGKPMAGVAVSASQAFGGTLEMNASAVTDEQGRAVFTVKGISGGYDVVTFTSGVVSVDMNTRVESVDPVKPKKPTANLADMDTVASGTQLVLDCATEGAVIYYTTDNTCPCTDGPNRKVYTGPVEISENTLFRIASWTEDGGYSERLNLRIYVADAFSMDAVVSDTACNVTLSNAPTGSALYCASYRSNGKMLSVEEWNVSGSVHTFAVHKDADYVKLFVVDGTTCVPVTPDEKIPVAK